MKRIFAAMTAALMMVALGAGAAFADINAVTPSTNDINRTNGWAHVVADLTVPGQATLTFTSTRAFSSCFEYRTDGDTSQRTSPTNYNPLVTDGLYPFYCQNNSTRTVTIPATGYVEVRMVFGAETDERFDWTQFNVLPVPYDFTGFFAPVDNLPAVNVVKAGSAIPVKFSLDGYQGLDIFAAGYPKSITIACDSNSDLVPIEETVTAGASSLSYDSLIDQYNYVWKTNKAWSGTCRQLVVGFDDGTFQYANFKFK